MSSHFNEVLTRNCMLLQGLFLGIYSVCYFGTVYIYLTRKSSRSWTVLSCISLMYLTFVVQAVASAVKLQSDSNFGHVWTRSYLAFLLANYLLGELADVLLTWRCFNVWGRNLLTASSASFLVFGEAVYMIVLVVNTARASTDPSGDFPSERLSFLVTIGLFITFGVTMILTLLIAYRIHSGCKEQIRQGTKGILKHILEIVLQSAALHVIVTFIAAIMSIVPFNDRNYESLFSVQTYISVIYPFTAGLAPTIMVARISFVAREHTVHSVASPPVSALRFQAYSRSAGLESDRDIVHIWSTNANQAQSSNLPVVQTEKW